MRQQKRNRTIAFALFVNEMYANVIDLSAKMMERIKALFLLPPVESILPISAQLP